MRDAVVNWLDSYGSRHSARLVEGTAVVVYRQVTVRGEVTGAVRGGRWARGQRFHAYHPVSGVQVYYGVQS
jgi:hypothetical protein